MKKVLIFLEKDRQKEAMDLLEVARQIYGDETYSTYAASINDACSLAQGKVDHLLVLALAEDQLHDPFIVTDLLEGLHKEFDFDCILILATQFGRMLAPRLALRLRVGLVADITAIKRDHTVLEILRPAFSGKVMAAIVQCGGGPLMMSVRPNVFRYVAEAPTSTNVTWLKPGLLKKSSLRCLAVQAKAQSHDISDSEVLISGGGGTSKNFAKLEQLAQALGGQVAASRKIIDKGLAPRSIQVGQSGRTVRPKLYIALGIDGAIQHMEGLKNVAYIISVNSNPRAPICSLSDLLVEGDALTFIDKLLARIGLEQ